MNSIIQKLPNNSKVMGFTHVLVLAAGIYPAAITTSAANTAQTFSCTIPARSRISNVLLDVRKGLGNSADPAQNTNSVSLGDSASATQFLSATEVNAIGVQTFGDAATTSSSTTLTSASAGFTSADVGLSITGISGIPANTTIASVTNGTTVVLSQAATATATGVGISIMGRGPMKLKAMTGSAKTYLAPDTLILTLGSQSGKALSTLNKGDVRVYVNLITDGEIG